MNYTREQKDPMKAFVKEALDLYVKDINEVGAGYRILGYAERGLLKIDPSVSAECFFDWYPRNSGFVILRLARKGLLSYKTA